MAATRKLFLSFTSTLGLIARNEIGAADLMTGLFYFGCTRSHALAPWLDADGNHLVGDAARDRNELQWCFKRSDDSYDSDRAALGHKLLVDALLLAEDSGRAEWRQVMEFQSFEALDALLVRNGHPPVTANLYRHDRDRSYSPTAVMGEASIIRVDIPGRIG